MLDPLPALATLGLLSVFARLLFGSWLAPGTFFPFFWFILSTISIFGAPDYPVSSGAMWWITITCAFFFFGNALFVSGRQLRQSALPTDARPDPIHLPHLPKIALLLTFLAAIYLPLFDLYVYNVVEDYPPVHIQFLLSCMHSGPAIGGILFALSRTLRLRLVALLPLLPQTLFCLSSSGRSGMVTALSFWFAGYVTLRLVQERGRLRLFTLPHVLSFTIMVTLLLGMGTVLTKMRTIYGPGTSFTYRLSLLVSEVGEENTKDAWASFRHGVLGHVGAFSFWFERNWDHPPSPKCGELLFAGPCKFFGIRSRSESFESFEVDVGIWSNVYSLFMPLVWDFTFTGSLFVVFFFGLITGWASRKAAEGNIPFVFLQIMFYVNTLSIGGLCFTYNTIIFAHATIATYLFWANRKRITHSPRKVEDSKPTPVLICETLSPTPGP